MIAGYSCSLAKSVGLNVNVFASSQDQHPGSRSLLQRGSRILSSSNRSRRVKSKTFTFHLETDTIERLTKEAEQQGLSVNVIANRALRKYVEWDVVSERFRVASTFSSLLVKLMMSVPGSMSASLGSRSGSTSGGLLPHPIIGSMASCLVSASLNCSADTEECSISTKPQLAPREC